MRPLRHQHARTWVFLAPPTSVKARGKSKFESQPLVQPGYRLTLYLNITDGRITEATFEARACAPVIAIASLVTERLAEMSLEQAREFPFIELDRELGNLPPAKRHAYLMPLECLSQALPQPEKLETNP